MENNNEIILRKIPLKIFIEVLTDVWNKGADYIDIIGVPNEVQDNIGIAVKEEYFSKEEEDDEELDVDVELEDEKEKPLDDKDLDMLI